MNQVRHYFSPAADQQTVHAITPLEVLQALQEYRAEVKGPVEASRFMQHLAAAQKVPDPRALCVRFTELGLHIAFLNRVRNVADHTMRLAELQIAKRLRDESDALLTPLPPNDPGPDPDLDIVAFFRKWKDTCVQMDRRGAVRALYDAYLSRPLECGQWWPRPECDSPPTVYVLDPGTGCVRAMTAGGASPEEEVPGPRDKKRKKQKELKKSERKRMALEEAAMETGRGTRADADANPRHKKRQKKDCDCECHWPVPPDFIMCTCDCGVERAPEYDKPVAYVPEGQPAAPPPLPTGALPQWVQSGGVVVGSVPLTILKMVVALVRVYAALGLERKLAELPDTHVLPRGAATACVVAPDPAELERKVKEALSADKGGGTFGARGTESQAEEEAREGAEEVGGRGPVPDVLQRLCDAEAAVCRHYGTHTFADLSGCSFIPYVTARALLPPLLSPPPSLSEAASPTASPAPAPISNPSAPPPPSAPVPAEVLEQHMQMLLDTEPADLLHDCGLPALRSLEARTAAGLSLSRFADTGFDSLLEFLTARPSALPVLRRSLRAGAAAYDWEAVGALLDYALAVAGTRPRASDVASAVCAHFAVPRIAALGHGPWPAVVQRYASECAGLSDAVRDAPVVYAAALAASWGCGPGAGPAPAGEGDPPPATLSIGAVKLVDDWDDAAGRGPGPGGVDVSRAAAAAAVTGAPYLSDIGDWVHWDVLFRATHGALRDFAQSLADAEGHVPDQPGGRVLRLLDCGVTGGCVWLDAAPSLAALREHVLAARPRSAALQLLSLVVAHGGLAQAPVGLWQARLASALAELEDRTGAAAAFGLHVLAALPQALQASGTVTGLLLPALAPAVPAYAEAMLAACADVREVSALHRVGLAHGVEPWRSDFRSAVMRAPGAAHAQRLRFLDGIAPEASDVAADLTLRPDAASGVAPAVAEAAGLGPAPMPTVGIACEAMDSAEAEGGAAEARRVVDRIRREEFGVGLALSSQGAALVERQNERLGRALQRLSVDLYSTDSHFVLELVQNADDNRYGPGVVPALAFHVGSDAVAVRNNEVGLTERNVRALCDVGRSTKSVLQGYALVGARARVCRGLARLPAMSRPTQPRHDRDHCTCRGGGGEAQVQPNSAQSSNTSCLPPDAERCAFDRRCPDRRASASVSVRGFCSPSACASPPPPESLYLNQCPPLQPQACRPPPPFRG